MIPVQKAMQAYSMTMNLKNKSGSFPKKDLSESYLHRQSDAKDMKKKFDSILEKAMQKN